jgi:hypothetical protein
LGVLEDEDLVELILSQFTFSPGALAKLIRTPNLFFQTGVKYLWHRADTRHLVTCVEDASRRERYASLITRVNFYDHEEIWPDQSIPSPRFPRVRILELYGSSLCVSDPQKLEPYLNDTLEELKIWSENDGFETPARRQGDGGWISHLRSKCWNLTTLKLEFAIFDDMPQLKTLRLGEQMNPVLNRATLSVVMGLPYLEDLSLEYELNLLLVHELVGTTTPGKILPKIVKLHVNFSEGDDVASALLLDAIPNLEELSMGIGATARADYPPSYLSRDHEDITRSHKRTLATFVNDLCLLYQLVCDCLAQGHLALLDLVRRARLPADSDANYH